MNKYGSEHITYSNWHQKDSDSLKKSFLSIIKTGFINQYKLAYHAEYCMDGYFKEKIQ